MKKIGVCGTFAFGISDYGGQPQKTRNLYEELKNYIGKDNIKLIDLFNWRKRRLSILSSLIICMLGCRNFIIMPAKNGVKLVIPFLVFLNIILKRKIHYVVIGGWLPELLGHSKYLLNKIKKIHMIYVETNHMKNKLNKMGLFNVVVLKNFKRLSPAEVKHNNNELSKCVRFCTFSRVIEEKGIFDAMDVIELINNKYNSCVCSLTIFGQIYDSFKEAFESRILTCPFYIEYGGIIEPENSTIVLKEYDILMFPTRYPTEGIPGTIIDAFFAGLPIISSKWDSFDDLIKDGVTGVGFELGNVDDFYQKTLFVIENRNLIATMSENCIKESEQYLPKVALQVLFDNLQ